MSAQPWGYAPVTPEQDAEGLYCPECGNNWDAEDRHHPEFDPSPMNPWDAPARFDRAAL